MLAYKKKKDKKELKKLRTEKKEFQVDIDPVESVQTKLEKEIAKLSEVRTARN